MADVVRLWQKKEANEGIPALALFALFMFWEQAFSLVQMICWKQLPEILALIITLNDS